MLNVIQQIHCQEPWFSKIKQGLKTVEGRKCSKKYLDLMPGDKVRFYSGDDNFIVEIIKVVRYPTLEEYLLNEGFAKVLPGIESFNAAVTEYLKYNSRIELNKYNGFLAIHLKVIS